MENGSNTVCNAVTGIICRRSKNPVTAIIVSENERNAGKSIQGEPRKGVFNMIPGNRNAQGEEFFDTMTRDGIPVLELQDNEWKRWIQEQWKRMVEFGRKN